MIASTDAISGPPGGTDARATDWLLPLALLAVVGAMIRAIAFTPLDALQGPAQKIFYVHAPSAFAGLYLGCGIVFLCSVAYLWLRDERLDRTAESAAEVTLVFLTVVLVTGPIWARPIWGTWWTWDARLTLTLFLWFVLLGYQILRGAVDDDGMRARYSAVLGVLGGVLVPFIHLSVYLFRTLHPQPIVLKPGAPSMPPEMAMTFAVSMVALTLLFGALVRARYRLATDRAALARWEGQS